MQMSGGRTFQEEWIASEWLCSQSVPELFKEQQGSQWGWENGNDKENSKNGVRESWGGGGYKCEKQGVYKTL